MARLAAGEIETATAGVLIRGVRDAVFTGVSIDSRTVAAGEMFFAICGPHLDGHAFIPDVWARGAAGAVVANDYIAPGGMPENFVLIRVQDTHEALKALAHSIRIAWPGKLVAVTGSMGKTTTREFACQLIATDFSAYQTPGNYNNLFGLPLALLGLESKHEVGIFEMGMSAAGEIAEMCRIARPDVGILTNVAPAHLEFFPSLEKIAEAKGELVQGLTAGGTLIYNVDDPLVSRLADRFDGDKISFGQSKTATVRADQIEISNLSSTHFQLSYKGRTLAATLPFAGAHYVQNTLPGAALGFRFGMTPEEIVAAMAGLRSTAMRGKALCFREEFSVIDDSYNSNPHALQSMIEVLAAIPGFSRRILIAGEMLELGPDALRMHCECGAHAVRHGIDFIIGVQGNAMEIVRAATEAGVSADHARFFETADDAAEFVAESVRSGDLVLIKGSRGVHMEKVVKKLNSCFMTVADQVN